MNAEEARTIAVWDPFVRVSHWALVATFFTAYFTEDDLLSIHVWAGYAVGCIVVLRVLWGFVGPKHARFSDFVFGPWKVWRYLLALIRFRAERYIGHSPAGGAMIIALFIGLAATVWSGLEVYAIEENAGPLAAVTMTLDAKADEPAPPLIRSASEEAQPEDAKSAERERDGRRNAGLWEEVHEMLANLALVLVIVHILGVGLTSVVHRENLPGAMITGRKRVDSRS